jgi:hypothetical protein
MKTNEEISQGVEDTAWASDRMFFKQHPRRRLRLRPAFNIEVEDFVRHGGYNSAVPTDWCHWIIVQLISPEVRARFPFAAHHSLRLDMSEPDISALLELICPIEYKGRIQKIRHQLASLFEKSGKH